MAFDNVRLPEQIERDSKTIPRFQTSVVTLGRGAEQRNVDWAIQRSRFDISYGIQDEDDYHEVRDFFYARLGKARGFLFKDWSDYKAKNQLLGIGNGVQTTFQLVKRYVSSVTYIRTILAPVDGTVKAYINGVLTPVSVNLLTGQITFLSPPAASTAITAEFEFDVPVRFDVDELPIQIHIFSAASIGSIELVELPTRT